MTLFPANLFFTASPATNQHMGLEGLQASQANGRGTLNQHGNGSTSPGESHHLMMYYGVVGITVLLEFAVSMAYPY